MADENKKQTDDFFRLIAEEDNKSGGQMIENPFAQDEIIFKDENGQIKILKGDQVLDLPGSDQVQPATKSSVKPELAMAPVTEGKNEDEEELNLDLSAPQAKPVDLSAEVKKIIQLSQLNFTAPDQEIRLSSIILSRLRDIRDQVETRELLLSPVAEGGMGYDEKTADRILQVVEQEVLGLNGRLREAVSQNVYSDLQQEAEKILNESAKIEPPELIFKSENQDSQINEVKAEESGGDSNFVKLNSKPYLPPISQNSFKPTPAVSERPKIQDVKFKPRLIGPVEEIASMTLNDFRRLAKSLPEIESKIIEKINILEEESFSQKVAAIKAWKQSEVYQVYLDMGHQSMEEKLPISQVIALRQSNSQPTLTEGEFEMVSDLNHKLRY
jgi:hypothetical protein